MKKTTITWIVVIIMIVLIVVVYFISKSPSQPAPIDQNPVTTTGAIGTTGTTGSRASSTRESEYSTDKCRSDGIGTSVGGRPITAYHYGTGTTELLFVGGIHGGYEWNTVLVAYQLMNYLAANPTVIPANIKVTVIPVLNPDGLNQVVGTTTGNFTAADVSTSQATVISGSL
jgi:murein tripeptide amidase MpaA